MDLNDEGRVLSPSTALPSPKLLQGSLASEKDGSVGLPLFFSLAELWKSSSEFRSFR